LQYQRQQQWQISHLQIRQLPSTSPAHASLNFDAKLALWRESVLKLASGLFQRRPKTGVAGC